MTRSLAFLGTFVVGSALFVGAFFAYDAMTYREDLSTQDIPVSELALHPRRGGPKNLPIIEHFIDDDESQDNKDQKHKPKLVLLGTGWGNIALLKKLIPGEYHVVVVSPSNYFCFTPMLPSATVGTLELRSLVEPVRAIIHRIRGHFLRGTAEDVHLSEKLIEISSTSINGSEERYYLPYDKLVIGVGMHSAELSLVSCRNAHPQQEPSQTLTESRAWRTVTFSRTSPTRASSVTKSLAI